MPAHRSIFFPTQKITCVEPKGHPLLKEGDLVIVKQVMVDSSGRYTLTVVPIDAPIELWAECDSFWPGQAIQVWICPRCQTRYKDD